MRIRIVITDQDVTLSKWSGGMVEWSECTPVASTSAAGSGAVDMDGIRDAIKMLLDRVPVPRWPRARVDVEIGGSAGRVKTVRGVPPIRRDRELLAMFRLNATQYVANRTPVVVTGAKTIRIGEAQIGVVDLALVQIVTAVINGARFRMGAIVPTDGDLSSHDLRGQDAHSPWQAFVRMMPFKARDPLALSYRDNPARIETAGSPHRLLIAAAALMIVAPWALYVHVERLRTRLVAATAEAARMAPAADSGAAHLRELARINQDIKTVAMFSHQRFSTALLLSALTDALPDDAALTTVRVDTANVDVVTLAPRTAAVVEAFTDVSGVEAPTIIGPVSREIVGGRSLERATIRMRIVRGGTRGTTAFAVEREESQ